MIILLIWIVAAIMVAYVNYLFWTTFPDNEGNETNLL